MIKLYHCNYSCSIRFLVSVSFTYAYVSDCFSMACKARRWSLAFKDEVEAAVAEFAMLSFIRLSSAVKASALPAFGSEDMQTSKMCCISWVLLYFLPRPHIIPWISPRFLQRWSALHHQNAWHTLQEQLSSCRPIQLDQVLCIDRRCCLLGHTLFHESRP